MYVITGLVIAAALIFGVRYLIRRSQSKKEKVTPLSPFTPHPKNNPNE